MIRLIPPGRRILSRARLNGSAAASRLCALTPRIFSRTLSLSLIFMRPHVLWRVFLGMVCIDLCAQQERIDTPL